MLTRSDHSAGPGSPTSAVTDGFKTSMSPGTRIEGAGTIFNQAQNSRPGMNCTGPGPTRIGRLVTSYLREPYSTEYWDVGPILVELDSHEMIKREFSHVVAKRKDGVLSGKGRHGLFSPPEDVATTETIWVSVGMQKKALLDSFEGEIEHPVITSLGNSRWHVDRGDNRTAELTFHGDILSNAEISTDGHTVTIYEA